MNSRPLKNKVQLITYPNSLGKDLKDLDFVLNNYFSKEIGGVHILPFYPSSGDRGFAPLTHIQVDKSFGSWDDIKKISLKYDLMVDLIVNHVSSKSLYFQDYLKNENKSEFSDYFITSSKFSRNRNLQKIFSSTISEKLELVLNYLRNVDIVFHKFGVNRFALKKVYRPRPESPFVLFNFKNKKKKYLWCTFTKEQIDLDLYNSNVRNLFLEYIKNFSEVGVACLRLDAVGYVAKKKGTKSFMIPETYDIIRWFGQKSQEHGLKTLPEIHNHYRFQQELSLLPEVDYVYDFQLPLLLLYSIYKSSNFKLLHWLKIRPKNLITTLDTHDGIPVVDLEDILTQKEMDYTSNLLLKNGGNEAVRASGSGSKNVDTYQINCTYYSALSDDDAYILSRVIQFMVPGIPQVYYVGLFAGKNDSDTLSKTGEGRDINRHTYTLDEIKKEVNKKVVKRLKRLMVFRNSHAAFDGNFSYDGNSPENILNFSWVKDNDFIFAEINLENKKSVIKYTDKKTGKLIIYKP